MTDHVVAGGPGRGLRDSGRLRILYDAYWWSKGPQSARVVVRDLLRAWREEFPQDQFVLAVRRGDREAVERAFPHCETVIIRGRPHGVATLVQYAVHARRRNVDLAYTQNFAPPGVWSATFIHDVLFQTDPEWFTRRERAYYRLIPAFARRAGVVLTSSRNEATRIRTHNPRVRDVANIGLSVSTELADAAQVRPAAAEALDSFLLCVGRLNIRKNLERTVQGALASGVVTSRRPLLVVGGEDGKGRAFSAEAKRAVESGSVVLVPEVSDGELAWLYANADLFLCLSLDEGFGLPPVEAAHFGCPVIVSDIDVFRETLGDVATYVDPLDTVAIADAIRLASTDRLRPPFIPATWKDCARTARDVIVSVRAG